MTRRRWKRRRAPAKPRPYIGPCYDVLRLWFLEYEDQGRVFRRYYEDRAAARAALREMRGNRGRHK